MDSLPLSTFKFVFAASIHRLLRERKCPGTEQPSEDVQFVAIGLVPKIELTIGS